MLPEHDPAACSPVWLHGTRSMTDSNPKVAYISVTIPGYKVWIVEALGRRYGRDFTMLHGTERQGTVPRDVGSAINISNNLLVRNRYLSVFGFEITWVPSLWWFVREKPNVIILVDNVRILSNYPIFLLARLRGTRIVFYGHGYDHQSTLGARRRLSRLIEGVRKFLLRRADAVIVYSDQGKQHLLENGIRCPVYVADNTLDTAPILEFHDNHDSQEVARAVRKQLGIPGSAFLITFLGRLIPEKRVEFMLDVIRRLALGRGLNVFGLIIGEGPRREELERYSKELPVLFAGYRSKERLWECVQASDVIFLPGMVGLAIIEAFCAGKPLITVRHDFHSPEICWLEHEKNGIFLEDFDLDAAEQRIARLMNNRDTLEELGRNARVSAETKCHPRVMEQAFFSAVEDRSPDA